MIALQDILAVASGSLVGFSLGLIGGGGSILAVPLLLYVVGVDDPHTVIGTTAAAVAANAFINLIGHARAGNVHWPSAFLFAGTGVVGAALGSTLGKAVDGRQLLFLFAILMLVVAVLMMRGRQAPAPKAGSGSGARLLRLGLTGLAAGTLSGFFGIGGGFLIVPGLMFGGGLPILEAIGTSLVSVGAFGLTTAFNYALSGLIAWTIAAEYVAGGILGGWLGTRLATRLGRDRATLNRVFAAVLVVVALYMMVQSGLALLAAR